MSSIIGGDGKTVEWRGEGRGDRLVRLRVSERIDSTEIGGDLFVGRRLEKNVRVVAGLQGGGKGVSGLGEGFGGYDGGCERRRRVKILQQSPAERYDRHRCVYGYARELREVLAAMHVSAKMSRRRVGEQDEGEGRDMSAVNTISFAFYIRRESM